MRLSCVLEGSHILVREADPSYDKPELIVYYWPTRFGKHDLLDWTGKGYLPASEILVQKYRGSYDLKFPNCGFWTDSGIRGNTKAVRVEREPLPCPKVRKGIETRYRDGRWQKLLKKGWVTA